ncbi:MAG: sigma-70 family RNA polymerase sigma factor, partial [Cruoricaptor ignavus]|nr:sigma-70 family RNA polymerase sigma factor [Cruoricaptor ignavus]
MNSNKFNIFSIGIKNGSEKHLEDFYYATNKILYKICHQMNITTEDAEEIVQDTYVAIWQQRHTLDENNNIIGLLKTIGKRKIINAIEKKYRTISIFENLTEKNFAEQNKEVNADSLKNIINELPQKQQEIVNLHYLDGISTNNIAQMKQISVRTVENHLFNAKKRLKKI